MDFLKIFNNNFLIVLLIMLITIIYFYKNKNNKLKKEKFFENNQEKNSNHKNKKLINEKETLKELIQREYAANIELVRLNSSSKILEELAIKARNDYKSAEEEKKKAINELNMKKLQMEDKLSKAKIAENKLANTKLDKIILTNKIELLNEFLEEILAKSDVKAIKSSNAVKKANKIVKQLKILKDKEKLIINKKNIEKTLE